MILLNAAYFNTSKLAESKSLRRRHLRLGETFPLFAAVGNKTMPLLRLLSWQGHTLGMIIISWRPRKDIMSWRTVGISSLRWKWCSLGCIQVVYSVRLSTSTVAITKWIQRFVKKNPPPTASSNCTPNFSSWGMLLQPFYLLSRHGKFSLSPPKMNEAILRVRPCTLSPMKKSWSTAAQTHSDTLHAANCSMRDRCALKRWAFKRCRRPVKRKNQRTSHRMTSKWALLATKRSELVRIRSCRSARPLRVIVCTSTS